MSLTNQTFDISSRKPVSFDGTNLPLVEPCKTYHDVQLANPDITNLGISILLPGETTTAAIAYM